MLAQQTASDLAQFSLFRKQITAKKVIGPNFSCFPWKMGQGCVSRWFSVIHVGGANMLTMKISKFCHFHTQTTVRERKESGGFVFPLQNGARLYIQILLVVPFRLGKPAMRVNCTVFMVSEPNEVPLLCGTCLNHLPNLLHLLYHTFYVLYNIISRSLSFIFK